MKRWLIMFGLTGVLSACTADGFTSIDGDKRLNQLDADEEVQLCEDSKAYARDTIGYDTWSRGECMYESVRHFVGGAFPNGAATIEACEQRFNDCLELSNPSERPAPQFCVVSSAGWPVGCALTVGDFVECSTSQFDGYVDFASLSCADVDFEAQELPIIPEHCSERLNCAQPP